MWDLPDPSKIISAIKDKYAYYDLMGGNEIHFFFIFEKPTGCFTDNDGNKLISLHWTDLNGVFM